MNVFDITVYIQIRAVKKTSKQTWL